MPSLTTRLSSKGQVVIPQALRARMQWEAGQVFEVVPAKDGVLLRPRRAFPATTLDDVGRTLRPDGPPLPAERLNAEALPYRDPYAESDGRR